MQNLKTLSLAITMLISFLAFSQERTISGMVTDGVEPLEKIHVMVKNKLCATSTGIYGYYSIDAEKGDTLVFSSYGMDEVAIRLQRYTLSILL